MTLAEEMALAVLRGDLVAASALADKLLEDRDSGVDAMAKAARALKEKRTVHQSHEVYLSPEFEAFCKRFGILWDLRTVNMTIELPVGEAMVIKQTYRGTDNVGAGSAETDGGTGDDAAG